MTITNNRQLQEGAEVLTDDHAELGGMMNGLLAALDKEDKAHLFERLDMLWARLAVHIRAEHLCLFPSILGALGKSSGKTSTDGPAAEQVREAIAGLREDHNFFMVKLAQAVNALRSMPDSAGRPSERQLVEIRSRIVAVRAHLLEHNRLEEDRVFLWAEMLLSPAEHAEMSRRMKREIENLPPRFMNRSAHRA